MAPADRPTDSEARAVLNALAFTDRFQRKRAFLALLARLTNEDAS